MLAARKQRNTVTVRRLKRMRCKLFRKQKSLLNMKDIIKSLKSQNDINEEAMNLIEQCFGTIPAELLKRKLHGVRNRKCCGLKKGLAARRSNGEDESKEVDRFMTLFTSDWSDSMSCPAAAAQKNRVYNKPDELPNTDHLLKLKKYSENKLQELTEQVTSDPSYSAWRELAEVALARLVVFNRRRANEPASLLLSQYLARPDWKQSSNQEVMSSLRPVEKVLMNRMDLIQVSGEKEQASSDFDHT